MVSCDGLVSIFKLEEKRLSEAELKSVKLIANYFRVHHLNHLIFSREEISQIAQPVKQVAQPAKSGTQKNNNKDSSPNHDSFSEEATKSRDLFLIKKLRLKLVIVCDTNTLHQFLN